MWASVSDEQSKLCVPSAPHSLAQVHLEALIWWICSCNCLKCSSCRCGELSWAWINSPIHLRSWSVKALRTFQCTAIWSVCACRETKMVPWLLTKVGSWSLWAFMTSFAVSWLVTWTAIHTSWFQKPALMASWVSVRTPSDDSLIGCPHYSSLSHLDVLYLEWWDHIWRLKHFLFFVTACLMATCP